MVPESLPGTPFEVIEIKRAKRWREVALWWPEQRTLVVAEALATNRFFPIGDDRVGVHPVLRLTPPRRLRAYEPEHLLVGHGEGVHGPEATIALHQALAARGSRRQVGRVVPFRMWRKPSEPAGSRSAGILR